MGADAVGMSTVIESIYAKYLNLRILGISCITNKAAGMEDKKLNHKEVLNVTEGSREKFNLLISGIIDGIE